MSFAGVVLLILLAYAWKSRRDGRPRFERVDRQGAGPLLSKWVMEAGYWALQPLARVWLRAGGTADQVSWCSLALGVGAAGALSQGFFGPATWLAALSAACDALDGMVAREGKRVSFSGQLLDASIDRYNEFLFIGALVIWFADDRRWQMIALFALLGSFMVSYSTAKAGELGVRAPRGAMRRSERAVYLISGTALSAMPLGLGVAPIQASLVLVGVVANLSAIARLRAIARAAMSAEKGLIRERA